MKTLGKQILVVVVGIAAFGFLANAMRDNDIVKQIINGFDA